MITMSWSASADSKGRRQLSAKWFPVVIPVPRQASESVRTPALQAS
jgi:hypothetical protein